MRPVEGWCCDWLKSLEWSGGVLRPFQLLSRFRTFMRVS
jgi:hypothetical protein